MYKCGQAGRQLACSFRRLGGRATSLAVKGQVSQLKSLEEVEQCVQVGLASLTLALDKGGRTTH